MQGKVVAITGASRGIGAAAARIFAQAGARVVLLARSGDDIGQIAAQIGPQAPALRCDVADAASLGAALDQAVRWGGRLDVLINNAGVIDPIARLAEADAADWPARALLWMCSTDADDWLGKEIRLRDEGIRARVGLI